MFALPEFSQLQDDDVAAHRQATGKSVIPNLIAQVRQEKFQCDQNYEHVRSNKQMKLMTSFVAPDASPARRLAWRFIAVFEHLWRLEPPMP
jgi:hypothetical protein